MNEFRGIRLAQVTASDLPMLYSMFSDPERFHLWGHRHVMDESQFHETWRVWSKQRMEAKFTIVKSGRPVGLVFDYDRSMEDGYSKVATLLPEHEAGRGAGVIATTLFGDWLFQTLPLRKLYFDVFGFNPSVVRMLHKLDVREEMRRVEHRYWNGKYWDCHGFSLFRDELSPLQQRLFRNRSLEPSRPAPATTQEFEIRLRPKSRETAPAEPARSKAQDMAFDDALIAAL